VCQKSDRWEERKKTAITRFHGAGRCFPAIRYAPEAVGILCNLSVFFSSRLWETPEKPETIY
jgi:hypothetical protein